MGTDGDGENDDDKIMMMMMMMLTILFHYDKNPAELMIGGKEPGCSMAERRLRLSLIQGRRGVLRLGLNHYKRRTCDSKHSIGGKSSDKNHSRRRVEASPDWP